MAAWTKQRCTVRGLEMAYVELGADSATDNTFVFLHGNPVSSALWRNIMPALAPLGRCLAPDLLGMGDSDALPGTGPGRYSFATHSHFLDDLLDALNVGDHVTLVVHDWGSGLGFDWACRHPQRVQAIAYMEAIVMPLTWEQWPAQSRPVFEGLRSAAGEAMILDKNIFVERILPASIMRTLAEHEMREYRRPFAATRESRWPTLDWPRQLPLAGEPEDVCARVRRYADWMATNTLPKLFINADPGAILTGPAREFCRSWHNQHEVTVPGIHFIQEDAPGEIVDALLDWLSGLHGFEG